VTLLLLGGVLRAVSRVLIQESAVFIDFFGSFDFCFMCTGVIIRLKTLFGAFIEDLSGVVFVSDPPKFA